MFRRPRPAAQATGETFGAWLLGLFADGKHLADLPFTELERLCAHTGSLLVGAAYAMPGFFSSPQTSARAAALVARRTADGFQASIADRENTVLAWPWDHMATTLAWEANRGGGLSEATLGRAIAELGGAYAARHREQAGAVLGLWQQVSAGGADLAHIGSELLASYRGAVVSGSGAAAISLVPAPAPA